MPRPSGESEGEPAKVACCSPARPSAEVARERRYVAGQWTRPDRRIRDVAGLDAFDAFLAERGRTLGLSGMAFQDAWTLDTERLRQCHIHVVAPDRRIIPFCAYNLTDSEGRALYRPKQPADGEEPDEGVKLAVICLNRSTGSTVIARRPLAAAAIRATGTELPAPGLLRS